MTEYFQVGVITQTHGLRGEVKVFPTTDDPARFGQLKEVLLYPPEDKFGIGTAAQEKPIRTLAIERARFFKQFVILKFRGLDRIEDVENLARCRLCVMRRDAVPLEENEYYIADLIGLSVEDEEGRDLGTLTDVLSTGANDVYQITKDGKDHLIPKIPEVVTKIDTDQGKIYINTKIIGGLFEDEN